MGYGGGVVGGVGGIAAGVDTFKDDHLLVGALALPCFAILGSATGFVVGCTYPLGTALAVYQFYHQGKIRLWH